MKKYIETGKIVSTHGVKGEIRVQPWADSPEFLCEFERLYLDEGKNTLNILRARVHKNIVIMQIEGIDSIEKASPIMGKILYIDRDDVELPEGSYFIDDLIGLDVFDADSNKKYGTLSFVSQTGANDVYHIKDESGKETLIAAVPSVVIKTDIENNLMLIRPLKGTFEDEN